MPARSLRRRDLLEALAAAALTGAAGCAGIASSDDDGDSEPGETVTETETSTATQTATTTDEPTATETPTQTPTASVTSTVTDDPFAIVATSPADDGSGSARERLLGPEDVESVGPVQEDGRTGTPSVSVTLTADAAERYTEDLGDLGFLNDEGTNACRWDEDRDAPGFCLLTVVDGEVVTGAGITPGLAAAIEDGEFAEDPVFLIQTSTAETAERIKEAIESGTDE